MSAAQLGVTTKDFRRETLRRNSRKIDEEISAALAEFVKNVSKALDQIIGDLDELLGTRNNYLLVEPKYAQKDILGLRKLLSVFETFSCTLPLSLSFSLYHNQI